MFLHATCDFSVVCYFFISVSVCVYLIVLTWMSCWYVWITEGNCFTVYICRPTYYVVIFICSRKANFCAVHWQYKICLSQLCLPVHAILFPPLVSPNVKWCVTGTMLHSHMTFATDWAWTIANQSTACWRMFGMVVVVGRIYTALFSSLEQTHWALVVCDSESSSFMVRYVHRNRYGLLGTGGRMGQGMRVQAHLPLHTSPELCDSGWVTISFYCAFFEYPLKLCGLLTVLFGCYMAGATWNFCRLSVRFTLLSVITRQRHCFSLS